MNHCRSHCLQIYVNAKLSQMTVTTSVGDGIIVYGGRVDMRVMRVSTWNSPTSPAIGILYAFSAHGSIGTSSSRPRTRTRSGPPTRSPSTWTGPSPSC